MLRLKVILVAGTAAVILALGGGAFVVLEAGERAARSTANDTLLRAAQSVENTLNRHLLQVDGALASLPGIFDALRSSGEALTADQAAVLLRELNYQTSAFRDLFLTRRDGTTWAAARSRSHLEVAAGAPAAVAARLDHGAAAVFGPVRNRVTGDWSLYLARAIELRGAGLLDAVAEIPVPVLTELLAENTLQPGTRLQLLHGDGELMASLPVDPLAIGRRHAPAPNSLLRDGKALGAVVEDAGERSISVTRSTLYGDVFVSASIDRPDAMTGWNADRTWIVTAMLAATLGLVAVASALGIAIGQRERADAEKAKAGLVLESAIESMSDGFVMWDGEDRFVTCNSRYLELYAVSAPLLRRGATFEEIIRGGVALGQYPEAEGRVEAFVDELVRWHRAGSGSLERLLPDGRWLLITERQMMDGGVVGIRTDITALKSALGQLAEAKEQANRAVSETRLQYDALVERDRALEHMAHHDDLTLLPNRALFRKELERQLAEAREGDRDVALIYLDLDHFKDVNDSLGHPIGDALLKEVACRLVDCTGGRQPVFRLGGDEFAVICRSLDPARDAEELSRGLIEAIGRPFAIGGRSVVVGASIGIAVATGEGADGLLQNADLALYRAKARGRGLHSVFAPEMARCLQHRVEMESDLRGALAESGFEIAYQPIIDLASDRACGFEALLRWRHPVRGLVSPGEFIPLAEEAGLIGEIGAWVLQHACQDVAALPGSPKVAVNLSPRQLASPGLVDVIGGALDRSGLHADRLELEITETALLGSDETTIANLWQLRKLGLSLVLDDFGTGYSSLSHLREFPLSKIKIDKSFVRDMEARADCEAIVVSVAQLAKRLGMGTTAEGVETEDQLRLVRDAGCTQAQGFLLGRPQPLLAAAAGLQRDYARLPPVQAVA